MKVFIEIPDAEYELIRKSDRTAFADIASKECMLHAIKTGCVIPGQSGRILILSEDEIKKQQTEFDFSVNKWVSDVALSNATIAVIE